MMKTQTKPKETSFCTVQGGEEEVTAAELTDGNAV
jgi:hypothetical protein